MGYCESTVEDGHLCLCVWSRLPLVVLYYSLPLPALLLPASISSVPTNTASVPPLLVDANTPCFCANTSTTSCAACLRLRFPRSQSMPTHPHFYFMCGVPTASVCSFSQCAARVFTHTLALFSYESSRCYLRFIIVGRTSFNQFSGFSMFSYPWPAPGDGDDYACAHAARCCCASVFGE